MSTIKVTHKNIEITYNENADNFTFELRGVSCTAKTIGEAKAKIDAPPPKIKKPFERFDAYYNQYASEIEEVVVTSLVERIRFHSTAEVWIVSKKEKQRNKVYERDVFPMTEHNNNLVAQIRALRKQIDAMQKQEHALKEKMKAYERPEGYDSPTED